MGFRSLGLGFESEKRPKWEWDWCFVSISVGSGHWLVGFGKKKWWLGYGIGNPVSGPSSIFVVKPFERSLGMFICLRVYMWAYPYEKSWRDMGQIQAIKKDANQRDMNVTSHGDNRR